MKVFSLEEAATYLKLTTQVLLRLAETHQIPCRKWSGVWKFNKDKLDQFLAGVYHSRIRDKTGLAEKYRKPTDWGHPLHVLSLQEAAEFLKVSPSTLLKDEDWQRSAKFIGKKPFYVRELIIDFLTRDMHFYTPYGSDRMEFSWNRWQPSHRDSDITILTIQEAADCVSLSIGKFKEMRERYFIRGAHIGSQWRCVKEKLLEEFNNLKDRMQHSAFEEAQIWHRIGDDYHRMESLRFEYEELRRFCDSTNPRRGRRISQNDAESASASSEIKPGTWEEDR